jgi:baculoviral IAP repeat-containing protein 2/3
MELAEAGLYYTGISDEVKCFHCDGGLREWEPNDNAWVEHAKWFPHCHHVILLKGKAFVKEVQKKNSLATNIAARTKRAEELMSSEPAISALNMGLDHGDVKKAILNQLEKYGRSFRDLNAIISAAYALAQARAHEESVNGVSPIRDQSQDSGFGSSMLSMSSSYARTSSPDVEGEQSASSEMPPIQQHSAEEAAAAAAPPVPAPAAIPIAVPLTTASALASKEDSRNDNIDLLCNICMENKVSIVILPCTHLCSCAYCASSLRNCPICRKSFKGYIRAFLS